MAGMFDKYMGNDEPASDSESSAENDMGGGMMGHGMMRAVELLKQAEQLHEAHMDGSQPIQGPEGERSQEKLMKLIQGALAALKEHGMSMKRGGMLPMRAQDEDQFEEGM